MKTVIITGGSKGFGVDRLMMMKYDIEDVRHFESAKLDFLSTYKYIDELDKLKLIFVPNRHKYSKLLGHFRDKIRFVSDIKGIFQQTKKTKGGGRITSLGQPGYGDDGTVVKYGQKSKRL